MSNARALNTRGSESLRQAGSEDANPRAEGPQQSVNISLVRAGAQTALVVELDRVLVHADLRLERTLLDLRFIALGGERGEGEAPEIDPRNLPYDESVMALIESARNAGRRVFLRAAHSPELARRIADHLKLDGVFVDTGSDDASRIVDAVGEKSFDYCGERNADPLIRSAALRAYVREGDGGDAEQEILPARRASPRVWLRALRIHQYAKNLLVFLPLAAAHVFDALSLATAALAFVAFSLCASSIYIFNDLVDIQDDRAHRSKRRRPLAAGEISIVQAAFAGAALFIAGVLLASYVSFAFLGVLLFYVALTTLYSLVLKRMMLLDVITLAGLYAVRVLGGAVAVGVGVSNWLIAFCLAIFISLALIKRYVELTARLDANLPDAAHRDYRNDDAGIIGGLAAAAGFNAVTILALYVSSEAVSELYRRPELLWLLCPVIAYWIGRALMLAHRRLMHDDPVVFALRDRVSQITIALSAVLTVAAAYT